MATAKKQKKCLGRCGTSHGHIKNLRNLYSLDIYGLQNMPAPSTVHCSNYTEANVIETFTPVIYKCLFVPSKYFKPTLMFHGKA